MAVAEAGNAGEILGCVRRAMSGDESGETTNARRAGASLRAMRLEVGEFRDPDGDVDAFLDRIDEAVGQRQFDLEIGINPP